MRASPTLPPLQSLRAFEAVGRLMSFRRAGDELSITQSAVSHHIAALERYLGKALFVRGARGIAFTPEGERYFQVIRRSLDMIASGTADLRERAGRERLRVSPLPSFAANWLVPRLARFTQAHPGIELVLDPTLRLTDLDAGEADMAIRYGTGNWDGGEARLLLAERLTPVAGPALLRRGPAIGEPRDVLRHPLLCAARGTEWQAWAEASGVDLAGARRIELTDYNIVLQAAIEGQGIALGRLVLIADRVRAGALVLPCPNHVTTDRFGHWLVEPRRREPSPAARAFAGWLFEEAETTAGRRREWT
ncbi:LysR substrate-binding domain-containing protein [Arenibaculum sp.]|jgi:LysR family glycine cleavage system transcriptional activator|uniref:LysR substrate-binding domain-containing protein n=1 Tax=Arenibaculum sp. TaxID=2865862 RepID=UPI002E14AAB4|nr:LysR substrate-binding domain-containing protein [Arenibaculum sp.]